MAVYLTQHWQDLRIWLRTEHFEEKREITKDSEIQNNLYFLLSEEIKD